MKRIQATACAVVMAALGFPLLARTNLLQNGGFEQAGSTNTTAAHWEFGNPDTHGGTWGSAERVDWRAAIGTAEGAIPGTWAGLGDSGGIWQETPCSPQAPYQASAWFWADAGWISIGSQALVIEFYDSAHAWLSAVSNTFAGAGSDWIEKTVTGTAPANAAWVRVVIRVDGAGPVGSLQFDVVTLAPVDGNRLQNPSFEDPGTGPEQAAYWEFNRPDAHGGYWGSAARVDWRAHSGSQEGAIRGSWAGAGSDGGLWQEIPGIPGSNYLAAAWFWADSNWTSTAQGLRLEFYDTNYTLVAMASNAFSDVGEQWAYRKISDVAPPGAAWTRAVVWVDGAGATGALQVDDVLLEENRAPPPGVLVVIR